MPEVCVKLPFEGCLPLGRYSISHFAPERALVALLPLLLLHGLDYLHCTMVTASVDLPSYVATNITPTLTGGLAALCRAKPADPVSFLAEYLLANKPAPAVAHAPVVGELIYVCPVGVPTRTRALFAKLDIDGDQRLTLDELTTGFAEEFGREPRIDLPALFAAHAHAPTPDFGERYLDLPLFNQTYAAILWAHFDENGDGFLQYAEAQRALQFIDPMPEGGEEAGGAVDVHDDGVEYETVHVATAFPADAWVDGELQLSPEWFWSVYQRMG